MSVTLKFCGAAGAVTGSCHLMSTPSCSFLVDCGLFQGPKTLKELNYRDFPFDPTKLDFVLQTHAHIDHSGLLPKLFKAGFQGPVYGTRGTLDLLSFMLPDSGHIQEFEVEFLNRRNLRRGKPQVTPIYTKQDAERCLENFKAVEYETWLDAADGVRTRFWNAGHILGSASIEIELRTGDSRSEQLRLLFSGDIGPDNKLFHPDPEAPSNLDYVICESTYGGRRRKRVTPEERRKILADEVNAADDAGGVMVIPIFAVERTQELITDLLALQRSGQTRPMPIFLDSPLAIRVTGVFQDHAHDLEDLEGQRSLLRNSGIHPTASADESKMLNKIAGGAIILSASGMCDAGRIRHHLRHRLWNRNTTVLFVGYQAPGTLGRLLVEGAKNVKIYGEEINVQARIRNIEVYSGHADGSELLTWIDERKPIKQTLFLVHGEEQARAALTKDLVDRGFPSTQIFSPSLDDEVDLLAESRRSSMRPVAHRLPADAFVEFDWHNDLAEFSFDLREAFEQAADEKSRAKLIRRLRKALKEAPS